MLLATVLNTGYTGRSAAGWAVPYNDSYERIVFQNGSRVITLFSNPRQ